MMQMQSQTESDILFHLKSRHLTKFILKGFSDSLHRLIEPTFAAMLRDIPQEEVKNIGIAVVKESDKPDDWKVYLVNLSDKRLENVIINSTGFGLDPNNQSLQTATFRHYLESLKPRSAIAFETIVEEIFHLSNRFWLSFYIGRHIYERKYEFVPGSIAEAFLVPVPFTGKKGVMII